MRTVVSASGDMIVIDVICNQNKWWSWDLTVKRQFSKELVPGRYGPKYGEYYPLLFHMKWCGPHFKYGTWMKPFDT